MSSIVSLTTSVSSEAHPMASAFAAFISAQMKTYFEQHGIPEGPERHTLASDASFLVLNELSPDALEPTIEEEVESPAAEASPAADFASDASATITSSEVTASEVSQPEAASPTPSESRRRSARILAAHKAVTAQPDESATIAVTASATGEGTHTRWSYADDPVDTAPPPATTEGAPTDPLPAEPSPPVKTDSSDDSATLAGSSDDGKRATEAPKKEAEAKVEAPDSPTSRLTITTPPSKKRVRIDAPPEEDGPARRTRTRLSSPPLRPSTGAPHYTVPRDSRAPSPPTTASHRSSSVPFNHYPQLPRPRPQGLRREHAFYNKSHFEIAWTPAFGDYDSPPKTVAEAMPEWLGRKTRSSSTAQAPTPSPSPPCGTSKKRARGEEAGNEEAVKGEKRPRRESIRERK